MLVNGIPGILPFSLSLTLRTPTPPDAEILLAFSHLLALIPMISPDSWSALWFYTLTPPPQSWLFSAPGCFTWATALSANLGWTTSLQKGTSGILDNSLYLPGHWTSLGTGDWIFPGTDAFPPSAGSWQTPLFTWSCLKALPRDKIGNLLGHDGLQIGGQLWMRKAVDKYCCNTLALLSLILAILCSGNDLLPF